MPNYHVAVSAKLMRVGKTVGLSCASDYRRQIPASPIIADTTLVGDDIVPAVSIPQETDDVVDKDHAGHTSATLHSRTNATHHEAITSLSQATQLVQGVIGLPLKSPSSAECARFTPGTTSASSSRLLTAKRKLLVSTRNQADSLAFKGEKMCHPLAAFSVIN